MYGHYMGDFEFVQLLGILGISIVAHIQARQYLNEKNIIEIFDYFMQKLSNCFQKLAQLIVDDR